MDDPLALRHLHAVVRRGEAAADAEDHVGVVQELADGLRDRASARAERQGVRLRERALALEARRDRALQELGKRPEPLPRLGVVDPLTRVDHRALGGHEDPRDLADRDRVRRDARPEGGHVVERLRHLLGHEVHRDLDQHRPGPAVPHLRERPPHRVRDRVGHDHLLGGLRHVLVVQERVEVGRHVGDAARVTARNDHDGHRVAIGLGDAAEGVLDAGAVLHREHTDPVAGGHPAHRVGHVNARALLADDDRPDVGLRGGLDDGVHRVSDQELDSLTLENLGDGSSALHRWPPGRRGTVTASGAARRMDPPRAQIVRGGDDTGTRG